MPNKLYATINHTGTFNFGHYIFIIKIGDNWYELDDINVTKIEYMDYK